MTIVPAPDAPAAPWGVGPRWQLPLRLLTAAGGGALGAIAFPPLGAEPAIAWSVMVLVLCLRGLGAPRGALVGLVYGAVFFGILLRWASVIGPDAWVLLAGACAVFVAAMAALITIVLRLPGWPVWVACLWVGQEMVRDRLPFGGFPWARLSGVGPDYPPANLAVIGGFPIVTFSVALAGALLAWTVVQFMPPRPLRIVAGAVAYVAVLGVGLLVPAAHTGDDPNAVVAVVQGGVPGAGLDALGRRRAVLDNHVTQTLQLAGDINAGRLPRPDLVVWPENSSDIDPLVDPTARAEVQRAVDAVGAPTLVGAVLGTDDPTKVKNAAIVWLPGAGPQQIYVKRHPVPFGEYVPFRRQLQRWISRFDRVPNDFVAGQDPGVLQVGPAKVGVVICFEVSYDEVVRDTVDGGADLLVVMTNNATYSGTDQPEQQFALTRSRAREQGRSTAVAATTGITALLGPDGQVAAQLPQDRPGYVERRLPLRTVRTPSPTVSVPLEWALAIVGVCAVVVGVVLGRRRRRPTDDGTETA